MKNSNECPKCRSTAIIHIPGQAGAYGTGNNIPAGGWTIYSRVKISRYLCSGCGFSEEWILNAEDIEKLKEKYQ